MLLRLLGVSAPQFAFWKRVPEGIVSPPTCRSDVVPHGCQTDTLCFGYVGFRSATLPGGLKIVAYFRRITELNSHEAAAERFLF